MGWLRCTLVVGLVTAFALPEAAASVSHGPGRASSLRLSSTPLVGDHVLGDGDRLLAVVHDERRRTYESPLASPASATVVDVTGRTPKRVLGPPRERCGAVGFHAGELLWSCSAKSVGATSVSDGFVTDVSTATTTQLPDLAAVANVNDESIAYGAVGARWVTVTSDGYHYDSTEYLNRDSGMVVAPDDALATDVAVSLDDAALVRPLCAHVREPLVSGFPDDLPVGSFRAAGGWSLGFGAYVRTARVPRLVLGRCTRAPLVLATGRDRVVVTARTLSARLVAWVQSRHAARVGSRRTLIVRELSRGHVGVARRLHLPFPTQLVALGDRVFAVSRPDDGHTGPGRVYRVVTRR